MRKASACILAALLLPGALSAQTSTAPKTIEEKRLQSTVEVQVIASLVAENGRAEKQRALDFIRAMVDKGRATEKSVEVVGLLEELGSEGTMKQVTENRRIVNDFPEVRREAAELLGRIGGDQARNALILMLVKDKEPMVASEAVYSLGLIGGGDQTARVLSVITSIIKSQDAVRPDSNFAFAAVAAIQMIGQKTNGQIGPDAMAALVQIQNGNYIRAVRERAKNVLDEFVKY